MGFHRLASLAALVSIIHLASAHSTPTTAEEIETQRALQAAAYYCAPAVAELTAARKRAWSQRVLATGQPSILEGEDLFSQETLDASPNKQVMECSPVEDGAHVSNNTCVLTPVVTEGPYYHLAGHPIRQNIAEYQIGLLTYLDIGVIDVNTCKPIPNVLVDIWHANSTGHYAGHPEPSIELKDEKPQVGGKRNGLLSAFPRTKPQETWLRGAWPTNGNGVAQFTTIFPGYYTGRATHIHTKVFTDWKPLENGTFQAGNLAHVGQFFFDDDINLQVDKMYPYVENPIRDMVGRTRNWRDSLNIFEDSHGPEGKYNPVFKMEMLGGVINQGFAGFITMGINATNSLDNWWKG
ncbi:aromatic compound dioxygenase [Gymnopus androsaceus JB14]|uniref:Aromatic compound dioxygenase n=1 Tax=Gymnopus androsaceus JB14 TaxID=1447944 RepID=A0A6A4IJ47_9AGAR|nr:aromatic compound dioxygenase [Gymnopus androsaceus JB14]